MTRIQRDWIALFVFTLIAAGFFYVAGAVIDDRLGIICFAALGGYFLSVCDDTWRRMRATRFFREEEPDRLG